MTAAEQISTCFALATLVPAVVFVVLYARPSERWWRSWFGISLMMIAVVLIEYSLSTALFRLYGPFYTGRDFVIVSTSVLAFTAISVRSWVLLKAQWHDFRLGRSTFWLFRLVDRLIP